MGTSENEKLELIRLVERSHLSVGRTLATLGISRPTFYRWVARYQRLGASGLEDWCSGPHRVWNRIPESVRQQVIELALEQPELSSRELAVTFTDARGYFISEASVYRLLKAQDLMGTPAFRVMSSRIRPPPRTRYGRLTSPISRSSVGVGSICRPSSMTSRAMSLPGSCTRR